MDTDYDYKYKQLLKDFILLEMLHDYKSERTNSTDNSKSARIIDTKKYKRKQPYNNKKNLDYILNLGVPYNVKDISYNEDIKRKFTNNEPETTMLSYMTNMKKKTTIQSFMNQKVLSSPPDNPLADWQFKCPISENCYNVRAVPRQENGVKFANALFKKNPVILTDTMVWVWKEFKSGDNPTTQDVKKIYCFSPLPVRADSASKADCTDEKTIRERKPYPWFQTSDVSQSGLQLVNVISNVSYTTQFQQDNSGFFSKFKITTELNPYDNNLILQKWYGLEHAGSLDPVSGSPNNRTVKINDAHYENSQPKTFIDIDKIINHPDNPSETFEANLKQNDKILNNLVESSLTDLLSDLKLEIVSLALQRKRSGDWLPVHYIKDFKDPNDAQLQNKSLNKENKFISNSTLSEEDKDAFTKDNMYILTNDRPLVSYCILNGVNVLFIASTTPDPLLIKFEKIDSLTSDNSYIPVDIINTQ